MISFVYFYNFFFCGKSKKMNTFLTIKNNNNKFSYTLQTGWQSIYQHEIELNSFEFVYLN